MLSPGPAHRSSRRWVGQRQGNALAVGRGNAVRPSPECAHPALPSDFIFLCAIPSIPQEAPRIRNNECVSEQCAPPSLSLTSSTLVVVAPMSGVSAAAAASTKPAAIIRMQRLRARCAGDKMPDERVRGYLRNSAWM